MTGAKIAPESHWARWRMLSTPPAEAGGAGVPSVPPTPGRDVVHFGLATALVAALGILQVFVVPRRLDVVTFGQYRVFLLYVTYLGALGLGVPDGAFLRWVGRPAGVIGGEWRRVVGWVVVIGGTILLAALATAAVIAPPLLGTYLVAIAACALAINAAVLAGYALQAAGDFFAAGRVAVIAPALFVAFVALLPVRSLRAVLAAYVAGYAAAAVVGALHLGRASAPWEQTPAAAEQLALRTLVLRGLPVLGANLVASFSQFADRILVSVSVPITSFALYGFASSVMVAASFATTALSRVALSHAGRRPPGEERARLLSGFYNLVAAAFGAAVAGVPLFDALVARTLPAYVPALSIVHALVIGAPFSVAIHVVVVGTLQSYGLVRRQLAVELAGAALVLAACGICLVMGAPLWGVAAAASGAAVVTWCIGVVVALRSVPAERGLAPAVRFALLIAAQSAALLIALAISGGAARQVLTYAVLGGIPTFLAARAYRTHAW